MVDLNHNADTKKKYNRLVLRPTIEYKLNLSTTRKKNPFINDAAPSDCVPGGRALLKINKKKYIYISLSIQNYKN